MIFILSFREIIPQDAAWAAPLLRASGEPNCEYSFVNIFVWAETYRSKIARLTGVAGDWVFTRSDLSHTLHYLFPAGIGDETAAVQALLDDYHANAAGRPLSLFGISAAAKERTEKAFPGIFAFNDVRDNYDYLYGTSDLAELPGKKFQKKRNHVSRFCRENPDWEFHPITPDILPQLLLFTDRWCHLYNNASDKGIANERLAIQRAFDHYSALNLMGGYVTAGGEIVAYSFASPINDTVLDVHVEKALYDVNGAYNIINREMARAYGQGFAYLNREDDLGEEGLRTAKLSYQPALLIPKFHATLAAR